MTRYLVQWPTCSATLLTDDPADAEHYRALGAVVVPVADMVDTIDVEVGGFIKRGGENE